jgi:N6-adenosine-specific RNA methylase IME4
MGGPSELGTPRAQTPIWVKQKGADMQPTELVVPKPGTLIPPGFAEHVRAFFDQCEDLPMADEARRRLAAFETYVRGREAKGEAQAAARLGETRIGELLGPAVEGRPTKTSSALDVSTLTPDERFWFRKMAQYRAIVEECLKDRKTSRAAVLNEISRRLIAANPPALPEGKYQAIIIDPPWPMPKIEREERPRQDEELDYPTMSLDEIKALPVGDLAQPDAHIYLWVTHKFLPFGLELLDAWDFRYQCVMTWRKNVGITPFSWMYDTEHVLFGRRGNLPLEQLGLRLSFDAPVAGHSIKPDVFYERVTAASPGPRLDMFPGVEHDGFEPWGLEATHRVNV